MTGEIGLVFPELGEYEMQENRVEKNLRLAKIVVPEDPENYYFVTFTSGEHETEEIVERHDVEVEVMVEGKTSLGEVEGIARRRAAKFVKALAENL